MDYNQLSYKYEMIINKHLDNFLSTKGDSDSKKNQLLSNIAKDIGFMEGDENIIRRIFMPHIDELIASQKHKEKEKEKTNIYSLKNKYSLYFEKFHEIAYRKVTYIDEYGDESWDLLDLEIRKFILKIQSKENSIFNEIFFTELAKQIRDDFTLYYNKHDNSISNSMSDVNNLSGIEFEQEIMKKLKVKGYLVQGTPKTGDQGADIIAHKDGKKIIIQAKRYTGSVGNGAIQEVISALIYYGGDEGWVITNSIFTNSAKALAQKGNIKLFDMHSSLFSLD